MQTVLLRAYVRRTQLRAMLSAAMRNAVAPPLDNYSGATTAAAAATSKTHAHTNGVAFMAEVSLVATKTVSVHTTHANRVAHNCDGTASVTVALSIVV